MWLCTGLASESEDDESEDDGDEQFEDDLEFLRSLDPKVRTEISAQHNVNINVS